MVLRVKPKLGADQYQSAENLNICFENSPILGSSTMLETELIYERTLDMMDRLDIKISLMKCLDQNKIMDQ